MHLVQKKIVKEEKRNKRDMRCIENWKQNNKCKSNCTNKTSNNPNKDRDCQNVLKKDPPIFCL